MSDDYDAITRIDQRQVAAYAAALGVTALPVRRLPVGDSAAAGISGLAWGTDPNVVLLHGGQLNAHTWDGMLLHAGLPALAYDLPGHGHSRRLAPESYTVAAIADAMMRRIRADCSRPVTLVGHSFGALIAIVLAARHPEGIERLVLLDATPHGLGTADQDPEVVLVGTFDELVDSVHRRAPQRNRQALARGVRLNARKRADGRWEWCWDPAFKATSSRRQSERGTLWSQLGEVLAPTTLVRGEHSEKVTPDMVVEFCAAAPQTVTLVAPDSGHNLHTDAPGWTAALLRSLVTGGPVSAHPVR